VYGLASEARAHAEAALRVSRAPNVIGAAAAAREHYQKLFELCKNTDAALPLVRKAREEASRLPWPRTRACAGGVLQ
jgi:hypothetical protein